MGDDDEAGEAVGDVEADVEVHVEVAVEDALREELPAIARRVIRERMAEIERGGKPEK